MSIMVTGATGTVGSLIVHRLAEAGADVKALVRQRGKLSLPANATEVVGDLTDVASLRAALSSVRPAHAPRSTRGPTERHAVWRCQMCSVPCFGPHVPMGTTGASGWRSASRAAPVRAGPGIWSGSGWQLQPPRFVGAGPTS